MIVPDLDFDKVYHIHSPYANHSVELWLVSKFFLFLKFAKNQEKWRIGQAALPVNLLQECERDY